MRQLDSDWKGQLYLHGRNRNAATQLPCQNQGQQHRSHLQRCSHVTETAPRTPVYQIFRHLWNIQVRVENHMADLPQVLVGLTWPPLLLRNRSTGPGSWRSVRTYIWKTKSKHHKDNRPRCFAAPSSSSSKSSSAIPAARAPRGLWCGPPWPRSWRLWIGGRMIHIQDAGGMHEVLHI